MRQVRSNIPSKSTRQTRTWYAVVHFGKYLISNSYPASVLDLCVFVQPKREQVEEVTRKWHASPYYAIQSKIYRIFATFFTSFRTNTSHSDYLCFPSFRAQWFAHLLYCFRSHLDTNMHLHAAKVNLISEFQTYNSTDADARPCSRNLVGGRQQHPF